MQYKCSWKVYPECSEQNRDEVMWEETEKDLQFLFSYNIFQLNYKN